MTVRIEEAVGAPPGAIRVTGVVHLMAADAYSNGLDGYLDSPLRSEADLSPGRSTERWFRIAFEQPFVLVKDFRFWMPNLSVPLGWTFRYGVSPAYQQPTNASSAIATQVVPTTRPDDPNAGGVPGEDGTEERYSDWIVLQASVDGDAPAGPLLGYDVQNLPIPIEYRFEWTQM